jgi:hypothetical protein
MTQMQMPVEPDASARPAHAPGPPLPREPWREAPLPLAYATPQPAQSQFPDLRDIIAMLVRRVLFALGAGLLVTGLVEAFGQGRGDASAFAGWGAGLIALVVPFPAMWRYWPTEPGQKGRTR